MSLKRLREINPNNQQFYNSDQSDDEIVVKRCRHHEHAYKKKSSISQNNKKIISDSSSSDNEIENRGYSTIKPKPKNTFVENDTSRSESESECKSDNGYGKSDYSINSSNELTSKQINVDDEDSNDIESDSLKYFIGGEDENESDDFSNNADNDSFDNNSNRGFEMYSNEFGARRFQHLNNYDETAITKQCLKLFTTRLESYIIQLDKMKGDLENISLTDQAYESSSELRRRAQLKTEEIIADLKTLNGYDINDDEIVLSLELQEQIANIYRTSEALIEKTESYEKSLISESETAETKEMLKEILAELDARKKIADNWTSVLNTTGISEKITLKRAREELNNFKLKEINEKISMLPINAKKLNFVESKIEVGKMNGQKIGDMQLKETISFEKLNILKFKEVETKDQVFTLPSRLFEVLDNGMYVIGGFVTHTKQFHLFIYDPIKKVKTREISFNKRVDSLFACNNKIALSQRKGDDTTNSTIKILDENLVVLAEKDITLVYIQSVNQSHLYCTQGYAKLNLILFDWNLNETKTDVTFQFSKRDENFFVEPKIGFFNGLPDFFRSKIIQLEKRENKYFVNVRSAYSCLMIFSETGDLNKEISTNGTFVIDSKNNIILNDPRNNSLTYFDLNGETLKSVSLKRPKSDNIRLKHFKIDTKDRLYFTQ